MNRVDVTKRRQILDPSLKNKDYHKYYNVDSKRLYNRKSKSRKMTAAPVKKAEAHVSIARNNNTPDNRAEPASFRAASGDK